jgi:hypothetical protein
MKGLKPSREKIRRRKFSVEKLSVGFKAPDLRTSRRVLRRKPDPAGSAPIMAPATNALTAAKIARTVKSKSQKRIYCRQTIEISIRFTKWI